MKAHMRRGYALFLTVGLSLLLLGCGGGEEGGGMTAPEIPNIEGSYAGDWTLTVEDRETGESATATCPGSINVDSQSSGSFSGSYLMEAAGDCDTSDSGTVDGEVRSDGGVNLTLGSGSGSSADFEDITGCTVTSGDSQLTGSVNGSMNIDAQFFADCPDGSGGTFETRWVFEFSGS